MRDALADHVFVGAILDRERDERALGREVDTLNRITVMFLDQAEFRAQRRTDIKMTDWSAVLDKFLADNELAVLAGAGGVSHEDALDWAEAQYTAFAERRRVEVEAQALPEDGERERPQQ